MPEGWPTGTVIERVTYAIDEVRPALKADGGDVRLVSVEGAMARVELIGACDGCPMAASTLADFVAERIKLYAPEIEDVSTG